MMTRPGTVLVATSLALMSSAGVRSEVQFQKIAGTDSVFSDFEFSRPAINDAGTVAFFARVAPFGDGGIFVARHGTITPVATVLDSGIAGLSSAPELNNSGSVVFGAQLETGQQAVMLARKGVLTPIAVSASELTLGYYGGSINNAGAVAFEGEDEHGRGAIFVARRGVVSAIADASPPFSPFGVFSTPTINGSGAVAFTALLDDGNAGVVLVRGGEITIIASTDPSGPFQAIGFGATVNDAGEVAFRADLRGGEQCIFIWRHGRLTPRVCTGRGFADLGDIMALNDGGTVAFVAALASGGFGLFVGADPVADRIIVTGDPLDGSVVVSVEMLFRALNEASQLVFSARLADFRQGIYVANVGAAR